MPRKGPPDPSKMPPISRVLNDIADEVEEHYPVHSIWLRNISKVLERNDAGNIVFDRRYQ